MDLNLPLKKKWFEMTKAGIKKEDYREMSDYWIKRLVKSIVYTDNLERRFEVAIEDIGIGNVSLSGRSAEELNENLKFKKFDRNAMKLGYPKGSDTKRILMLPHKGIEVGYGRPEWGAEPNRLYFIIKHGN